MRKYVVYTRVSTKEQGRSGLGLEAQRRDIDIFLQAYSDVPWEIVGTYQDVGSGADNGRPELQAAIAMAKANNAELLVAKLDRLSRKVSYLAALLDDKQLKLRVASMPAADKFQLHIYAALAEQERDFISTRTKAALAAAKARGVKLGGVRGDGLVKANAARRDNAEANAVQAMGLIAPLRAQNMSLAAIADMLNAAKVDGGGWSAMKVKRSIERAA